MRRDKRSRHDFKGSDFIRVGDQEQLAELAESRSLDSADVDVFSD